MQLNRFGSIVKFIISVFLIVLVLILLVLVVLFILKIQNHHTDLLTNFVGGCQLTYCEHRSKPDYLQHCGLVVSAPAWDGTGCEFDSCQCLIYIPCSLSLRLLGSLRDSLGTYGLTKKSIKKIVLKFFFKHERRQYVNFVQYCLSIIAKKGNFGEKTKHRKKRETVIWFLLQIYFRTKLDMSLKHVNLEKSNAHEIHARKVREKDQELRNLKKAELQLKVAQDALELTSQSHKKLTLMVSILHFKNLIIF